MNCRTVKTEKLLSSSISLKSTPKNGDRTDVPVKLSAKAGGIAPFWGGANLPGKLSSDIMGYRSNSLTISRDTGPLSHQLITLQPESIAKLILKTFFYVTDVRFSKKIIPKRFVHVIR